jgi:hypothetical protein
MFLCQSAKKKQKLAKKTCLLSFQKTEKKKTAEETKH